MSRDMSDKKLINKFLCNTLSSEEESLFASRAKDEAFISMLENEIIIQKGRQDLKARLKEISKAQSINKYRQPKKKVYVAVMSIAASVILFVILFKFNSSLENSNLELLTQKAWDKNVGLNFLVRGESVIQERDTILRAFANYENKEYNKALTVLQNYDRFSAKYESILIIKSLSLYKMNNTDEAIKTLDTLETYNLDIARWYKGLIYLSKGDKDRAYNYLIIPKKSDEELKLR